MHQDGVSEIIVWDDGSLVDVSDVRYTYVSVRLIMSEHVGKSHARNGAVAAAKNELIYPIDADDWIEEGAIAKKLEQWDGTPVYSDIVKVHDGNVMENYPLVPFDCDEALDKCISVVNVLHSKEQWASIGGWDERLNLYEDWEYNGRLFWMYGGKKINLPLVYYRQHAGQSTMTASKAQTDASRYRVKSMLQEFARRHTMGCCGKKRAASNAARSAPVPQPLAQGEVRQVSEATVMDLRELGDAGPGKVWARYLGGKGMGKHERRGMASRKKYTRISYGGRYAVRAEDVVSRSDYEAGARSCGMVRIEDVPRQQAAPVVVAPAADNGSGKARKPVGKVSKSPAKSVVPLDDDSLAELIKDVGSFSIRELRGAIAGLPHESVASLLAAEKARDVPRIGAVKLMEKALDRKLSEIASRVGENMAETVLNGDF
jgi:glycosyltransferase involved in cell wall biosynthesis